MKKIYKYELDITDNQTIDIPSDTILSVMEQNSKVVVYALVDTENVLLTTYEFGMNGTGNPINFDVDSFTFLGTVKLYDGGLMFHVFYKKVSC
jgi:hypothetical protein